MSRLAPRFVLAHALMALAVALAAFAPSARAAAGDLDFTFGPAGNGRVVTALGGPGDVAFAANPITLPGNGGVLGAASLNNRLVLERYTPAGAPDPSFGVGGQASAVFPGASAIAAGAVRLPDGSVIVVGSDAMSSAVLLAKFTPEGALDPTFGTGGSGTRTIALALPNMQFAGVVRVALQGSSLILAGFYVESGATVDVAGPLHSWLARVSTTAGVLDAAFGPSGAGGFSIVDFSADAFPVGLGIQSQSTNSGKIVLLADVFASPTGATTGLARLTAAGRSDTAFGTNGETEADAGIGTDPAGMTVRPDDSLWVLGTTDSTARLARFSAGGQPASFDPQTSEISLPPGGFLYLAAAATAPDGKLVAAGGFAPDLYSDENGFAAVRWNADGTPDAGFGAGGAVTTMFGAGTDGAAFGEGVAVQADGKPVVLGECERNTKLALARYLDSGSNALARGTGAVCGATAPAGDPAPAPAPPAPQGAVQPTVTQAAPPPPPIAAPPTPPALTAAGLAAALHLPRKPIRVDPRGNVLLGRLTCPPMCRLTGTLVGRPGNVRRGHRSGARRIGRLSVIVPAGRTLPLRVKLTRAARRTLAHRHRITVTLTVTATDEHGRATTVARRIVLSSGARRHR